MAKVVDKLEKGRIMVSNLRRRINRVKSKVSKKLGEKFNWPKGTLYRIDQSVLCGWSLDTTNGRDSRRDKLH